MTPAPIPPLAAHGHLALTEPELASWGERLGRALQAPTLVTIAGDLGAGKTTLVRAICRGYGVRDDVTSPTFALVHEYAGRGKVYHLDLYRLERPDDLTNIGWDDIISDEAALVLVEWPERAGRLIPTDHVPIHLEHLPGDASRRLLYAGGHVGTSAFGGEVS